MIQIDFDWSGEDVRICAIKKGSLSKLTDSSQAAIMLAVSIPVKKLIVSRNSRSPTESSHLRP